jgi:hypothetical protein
MKGVSSTGMELIIIVTTGLYLAFLGVILVWAVSSMNGKQGDETQD